MPDDPAHDVTRILADVERGDDDAADRLLPLVYDQLRDLAAAHLHRERAGHTLQATALVHEAYLKLVDQRRASWNDRTHFFAVAATAMRRILVNHAKAKQRLKRGGDRGRVPLDGVATVGGDDDVDLVALDDALVRLADLDPDAARVVELRFFAGLTADETARAMDVSVRSVHRDWAAARAWLRGALAPDDEAPNADDQRPS